MDSPADPDRSPGTDSHHGSPDSTHTGSSQGPPSAPEGWFGPYRLLEEIGEGGFGKVYLAEQRTPVVRRVALKIIKPGMGSRQVIARFDAERQALAMMDHPSIAKVLDADATPDGQPYFVMELVQGTAITQYCDQHRLATAERLDLFIRVCHAVQHAHQKGVIHRDIKPSNVLVADVDGMPVPKVIDFGIAKAISTPLTDKTLHTELHQALGTPEYMSPEQAGTTFGTDVDTRADIYSLGVLLYELLTGTTPFEADRLRAAGWLEMLRIIREVDPPAPSTRLSEMQPMLPRIAAARQTDAVRLPATIRGDLDWIVMKCLEKERNRRYDTANGLALDIGRHLAGEPVLAAPPRTGYRLRKFVRRNRGAVTAAVLMVLLLLGGIAGTTYGLVRAETRRTEAEAQRREAEDQKETAQQVLRVFQEMLEGVKAEVARGRDTSLLKQILDRTRTRVEGGEFRSRPAAELTLRSALGLAYLDLGDHKIAEPILTEALKLARGRPSADVTHLTGALTNLAGATYESGRIRDAEPLFQAALDLRRQQFQGDHADIAAALDNLGTLYDELGRHRDAEAMLRSGLEMRRRLFTGDHEDIAYSQNNLAFALQSLGRLDEAEPLHRDTVAMRRRLYNGPHPQLANSLNNLAMVLGAKGQLGESESLYAQSLAMRQQLYQGDHPSIANAIANLAVAKNRLGRFAEAEKYLRDALAMRRRIFTSDHPAIVTTLDNLAVSIRQQGRPKEAEPLAREAVAMGRRIYATGHGSFAVTLQNAARTLLAVAKVDEAEALAREARAMTERLFAGDHEWKARCLDTLANVLRARARWGEAESVSRETLSMRQRLFKGDHADVAQSLQTLSRTLAGAGRTAEAVAVAQQALAMAERVLPAGHASLSEYRQTMADMQQPSRTTPLRRP
jgi:serine/threonine protein kinase/tetratricopeptide (TPR) repeat protein